MNSTVKTVLLTVLTLSLFTIALIEVSGISNKAFFNVFKSEDQKKKEISETEKKQIRETQMKTMEKTIMKVKDSVHNFGEIKEGAIERHIYLVENIGDKPLFIGNVQTSCGCTVPKFSEELILPGQVGTVLLEFNSAGKKGSVQKKSLIIANAENAPYPITFNAEVLPK